MLHRRGHIMRVWQPADMGKAWATLDIKGDIDGVIDEVVSALCEAGLEIEAGYNVVRSCGPKSEVECYRLEVSVG